MKVRAFLPILALVLSSTTCSAVAQEQESWMRWPHPTQHKVTTKMVSVLYVANTVFEGHDILPSNLVIRQVPEGQVPPDAISTKDLVHVPHGLTAWQARYTLAEGTLVSYHALAPGCWHKAGNHWSYGSAAARQLAKTSAKRKPL